MHPNSRELRRRAIGAIIAALALTGLVTWFRSEPWSPVQPPRSAIRDPIVIVAHKARAGSNRQDETLRDDRRHDDNTTSSVSPRVPSLDPDAGFPGSPTALSYFDDLPWGHDGLCMAGASVQRQGTRARYLATFASTEAWRTTLYVHPTVPDVAAARLRDTLEPVHDRVTSRLGLSSSPPLIYLYPSVEALREHSCASANADAYYDGAIHLALVAAGAYHDLPKTLAHEYVHHVLVGNGIGKPIWFQEGMAMVLGHGAPSDYWKIWRENPIVLHRMVGTFPTTEPPEVAEVFYAQAYVMMEFLERLCLGRAACGAAELADALNGGRATPEGLFDWATRSRGSDLFTTTPKPLWQDYADNGNFAPATLEALLQRAMTPG